MRCVIEENDPPRAVEAGPAVSLACPIVRGDGPVVGASNTGGALVDGAPVRRIEEGLRLVDGPPMDEGILARHEILKKKSTLLLRRLSVLELSQRHSDNGMKPPTPVTQLREEVIMI